MLKKLQYNICIFLYALKEKEKISKNTLFRYVYIFNVSNDYLTGRIDKNDENLILDKELGLANLVELTEAINALNSMGLITISSSYVMIENKLLDFVKDIINKSEFVREDVNKILYFVKIVSSYNEDVILSAFFNEPNVEEAVLRGKKEIKLSNNKLKELLETFEKQSQDLHNIRLGKYDVFSSWLDYVFEEYLKEKKIDE